MQKSSAPDLKVSKEILFGRVLGLLEIIQDSGSVRLDETIAFTDDSGQRTWRNLGAPLVAMGLLKNQSGKLILTGEGKTLLSSRSHVELANLLASRVRLFAELLNVLAEQQLTIKEALEYLVEKYQLNSWKSVSNIRSRITWLEVLGLVEWLPENKLGATPLGREVVSGWQLVSPAATYVEEFDSDVNIPEAPAEVQALLDHLRDHPEAHLSRNTYNIWVPSPASDPCKIENMQTCISFALDPISRDELMSLISTRFDLKRSSVDSMMPFMRAAGLIQEVRRGTYVATPAAAAWVRTGSYINFVRILHSRMRFVGEILVFAKKEARRARVYEQSTRFGMNREKTRWLINFLVEAGLLVESSYSSVRTTSLGLSFIEDLPIWEPPVGHPQSEVPNVDLQESKFAEPSRETIRAVALDVKRFGLDPNAGRRGAGSALELAIQKIFSSVGFMAKRIGGAGDTDVVIQWLDEEGDTRTAVVDAKSTASGAISHTSVSDVAISSHQKKHSADYVAIIAPGFTEGTLTEIAARKSWSLISTEELAELFESAFHLGLPTSTISTIFIAPDGARRLAEAIESQQRKNEIIKLIIRRVCEEWNNSEPVSARDISLIERNSNLAPTVEELVSGFDTLMFSAAGVLQVVEKIPDPKHRTYRPGEVVATINKLRGLAASLEAGSLGLSSIRA